MRIQRGTPIKKRGGTKTITIEMIANDDVGAIRRIPSNMSRSAKRTLYEFAFGLLTSNPNAPDGVKVFHSKHNNLGSAALDKNSYRAARLALRKQIKMGSNKALGFQLRNLIVPVELESVAYDLFKRDTNIDPTFEQSSMPKIIVPAYWSDANNWYAAADKRDVPLGEIGFWNGNEEPEIFVQDNPTQGSMFAKDQITYKLRHVYDGNLSDFRGWYGAVVA